MTAAARRRRLLAALSVGISPVLGVGVGAGVSLGPRSAQALEMALIGPTPAAPPEPVLDLRAHGARGDGRGDDGPAFRAVIAQLEQSPTGGRLHVPAGLYRIREPIDLRTLFGRGIALTGDGIASRIRQSADNQPIVILPGMHSMLVRDLALDYERQQPASATEAVAIAGAGSGISGFYNSTFENLLISQAAVAIGALDEGSRTAPIWGNRFSRIMIERVSLNGFRFTASAGQPNPRFESIYSRSPQMQGYLFELGASDGVHLDNIEINEWGGHGMLNLSGGGAVNIGQWRIEVGSDRAASSRFLFNLQNLTWGRFDRLAIFNIGFERREESLTLFNVQAVGVLDLACLQLTGNRYRREVVGFNPQADTGRINIGLLEVPDAFKVALPGFDLARISITTRRRSPF